MEIKTFSPKSHKIKALIYWPSWSGKTTFGATAENVLFASAENWLLSVADKSVAYTQINKLEDLYELRDFLQKWNHEFETLVIDSITEINDIIKEEIEKRTWRKMQIQDWGELSKIVEWIIKDIKNIDINVIVIAQELYVNDDNKIQKIVPSLNWKSATKICYYMDIVGYMYVDKEWRRTIITNPSEKLLTKDRTWKIWNDTTLNFEEWKKLVNEIATWDEKILYKTLSLKEAKELEEKKLFEKYKKDLESCKTLDELKKAFMSIKLKWEKLKELTKIKDEMKIKIENIKEEKVEEKKGETKTKKSTK